MFCCSGGKDRGGNLDPNFGNEDTQSKSKTPCPVKVETYMDVRNGILHPTRMVKRMMIPVEGRRLFDLETELENCDKLVVGTNKERLKLQERLQELNERLQELNEQATAQDAKRDELVDAITAEVEQLQATQDREGVEEDGSGVGTLGRPAEEDEIATFASAHSMGR